jgi:hypothetical protein
MLEAMFEILCDYVENDLARGGSYDTATRWETFKLHWFPRTHRYELSRKYAMKYLEAEMQVDGDNAEQAAHARIVKDLYEWYRDEYPFIKNPYETENDPQNMFVDTEGNPTNEVFAKNTQGKFYTMNKFHPEYSKLLENMHVEETRLNAIIDSKLEQLLSIRRYLWT